MGATVTVKCIIMELYRISQIIFTLPMNDGKDYGQVI